MYEIHTEIEINAPSRDVWSVLTNFTDYASWNPFIKSISGKAHAGERLTISVTPRAEKHIVFRPVVLVAKPESEFRWLGRWLMPGLVDGEHYFQIIPSGPHSVRFVHGEVFSGILSGLLKSSLSPELKTGFNAMNLALKARTESLGSE